MYFGSIERERERDLPSQVRNHTHTLMHADITFNISSNHVIFSHAALFTAFCKIMITCKKPWSQSNSRDFEAYNSKWSNVGLDARMQGKGINPLSFDELLGLLI